MLNLYYNFRYLIVATLNYDTKSEKNQVNFFKNNFIYY